MKRRRSPTCQFYQGTNTCAAPATHDVYQDSTLVGQACQQHAERLKNIGQGITIHPRTP
jgi:hypothetical protein